MKQLSPKSNFLFVTKQKKNYNDLARFFSVRSVIAYKTLLISNQRIETLRWLMSLSNGTQGDIIAIVSF